MGALLLAAVAMTTTPPPAVIPKPASIAIGSGAFVVRKGTTVSVSPATAETRRVGNDLAALLGGRLVAGPAKVKLELGGGRGVGAEGYELTVASEGVRLVAGTSAGLFHGVQTVRQLLPVRGPRRLPAAVIRDRPRFPWRGAMLDVARHFRTVRDVERFIDLMALYKLNRLHLHLSDDQGWRIAISKWPRLATHGGSTQVGGGKGGYYTQRQYAAIVRYAAERYIDVVPEIDMPGHVHAALSSYPELACDGKPSALYTGIEVGFSSLCVAKPVTYRFVDDVIGELAALTPSPWIHVGGDEAAATKRADYVRFVNRIRQIVERHGKRMVGWEEVGQATLDAGSIVQHWNLEGAKSALSQRAVAQGAKVIMSPAAHAYLDMKYDASTRLGLQWAGFSSVRDSYAWDPARVVPGLAAAAVLGVEAPLWSETVRTMADAEYLAFPRLIGIAEIGWSPARGRSWSEYRLRLGAQGPLLAALGVNYYRSPEVPWR
ncbi:MAG TPA: beta-N-acetylhexosaminidase [Gaiellaceae bacterium]|nr:beta-N-acetylhexosaminidase [Gaiellaceae bacterium]